jgi:ribosomal protein S18 acetylase RimI-like enzyme
MSRMLLRMERRVAGFSRAVPEGYLIAGYRPAPHHQVIPEVFGAAFDRKPWSSDWHSFDEFDPEGDLVAIEEGAGSVVGFALCFQRRDFGYISVVAVDPMHQRLGLASALVSAAVRYLGSLGLETARVDAWEDSESAVLCYQGLGFKVFERRLDDDED